MQSYDYSPVHFAGKERDWWLELAPTNLDNFGARFYSSSLARFMSPDWAAKPTAVPYANFGNPQSLNLYSYVKNNPVTTRDPDGHCDPGLNCLETNFKAGLGQIENAAKAAAAVTVGTIGAGVGEVVAGVESGNGNEITHGLDKIGATVTVLAVGAESGGETAEGEGTVTDIWVLMRLQRARLVVSFRTLTVRATLDQLMSLPIRRWTVPPVRNKNMSSPTHRHTEPLSLQAKQANSDPRLMENQERAEEVPKQLRTIRSR